MATGWCSAKARTGPGVVGDSAERHSRDRKTSSTRPNVLRLTQ